MEKTNDEKLLNLFQEVASLESKLNEMSKEELINLLVIKFLNEYAPTEPDEKGIDLWYYIDPESGSKYITNECPEGYMTSSSEYPVFLTDGEINIRVPNMMEGIFPELNTESTPVKVHLTVSF